MNIVIDEEFKSLIPPLADEERHGLENSLLAEGCRDALVVWECPYPLNNKYLDDPDPPMGKDLILIDGHNRYEICTKYHIQFETVKKDFDSRDDAKLWMMRNQLARRNLNDLQRIAITHKCEDAVKAKARERQGERNDLKTSEKNFAEVKEVKRANDELGAMAGVSGKTYEHGVKVLEEAPKPVVDAAMRNELSINMAHEVTKLEPEQQEEIAQRIEHIEEEPEKTQTPKAIVQEVIKRPHVSFNSGNNEWYTPAEYIEAARSAMGSIDLDPASNDIAQKVVKAGTYYTAETNGLDKTWNGNVWMNPPYASELIEKFIDKLVSERGNYAQAIVLVNNATETGWFNKIVSIASAVCFPKSRVKFYMPDGKTGAPLQGQAILYIGENKSKFAGAFSEMGWIADVVRV